MVLDDALSSQKNVGEERTLLPYEEVRDYFHYHDNYIDQLDRAAEDLALRNNMLEGNRLPQFQTYLEQKHNVRVRYQDHAANDQTMRQFDVENRVLSLNSAQDDPSLTFLLAHQIALLEYSDLIEDHVKLGNFQSEAAEAICRIGLANYFAGALCFPYRRFLDISKEMRHDLRRMSHYFGASLEQIGHRLSSMQRSGARGFPSIFCVWTGLAMSIKGILQRGFNLPVLAAIVRFGMSTKPLKNLDVFWFRLRKCPMGFAIFALPPRLQNSGQAITLPFAAMPLELAANCPLRMNWSIQMG